MSNHLQHYRDWETVAVPAERRNIVDVTDEAMSRPPVDDVIDLRDDAMDGLDIEAIDLDAGPSPMAKVKQSNLAAQESAKRDAGPVPLGLHIDLRG